jgi:hypothetical protein
MFLQKSLASGTHFLLSLAAFAAFIFTLLYFWFPEPYFTASGGLQGFKLVAIVDLVMGPLLTFVAFNIKKPKSELARDLGIIVLLQLAALMWGINAVWGQRPIAVVFWENSFYTVPYEEMEKHYRDSPEFEKLKEQPRQLIYGDKPVSIAGIEEMLERVKNERIPPHQQLELYRPLAQFFDVVVQHAVDIKGIVGGNSEMREKLDKILTDTNTRIDDNIYLPLQSRYRNIILVFDQQGKQLGYIAAPYKKNP